MASLGGHFQWREIKAEKLVPLASASPGFINSNSFLEQLESPVVPVKMQFTRPYHDIEICIVRSSACRSYEREVLELLFYCFS